MTPRSVSPLAPQSRLDPRLPRLALAAVAVTAAMLAAPLQGARTGQAEAGRDGWNVAEEPARGWRRVVASPRPVRIVEIEAIRAMLDSGVVTIASGGGGIPVVADEEGQLHGVGAVIDKDLTAALLASAVDARLLVITTNVEKVALNLGKPHQKWIDTMTLQEARAYLAEGVHFPAESMGPKIRGVIDFLEKGGERAIITSPGNAARALKGEAGTQILP